MSRYARIPGLRWMTLLLPLSCANRIEPKPHAPAYIGGDEADVPIPSLQIQLFDRNRYGISCSAVKVADRLILTAAHCVLDETQPMLGIEPGSFAKIRHLGMVLPAQVKNIYLPETLRSKLHRKPYLKRISIYQGPDLAVIEFRQDLKSFQAMPIDRETIEPKALVLEGGYGCRDMDTFRNPQNPTERDKGSDDQSPLRVAQKTVVSISETAIFTGVTDTAGQASRLCYGDSGGPLYLFQNGKPVSVVGINSRPSLTSVTYGPLVIGPEYNAFARVDAGTTTYSAQAWIEEILLGRATAGF